MITVDAVRTAVHTSMPTIVSDLTDLVAIPSVSASSHDQSQVQRSAEAVAALLRDSGLDAEILFVPAPDGTPGRPAVLAHKAGPQGSPHVLLYSHHDVQPVGDPTGWDQADPFTPSGAVSGCSDAEPLTTRPASSLTPTPCASWRPWPRASCPAP